MEDLIILTGGVFLGLAIMLWLIRDDRLALVMAFISAGFYVLLGFC